MTNYVNLISKIFREFVETHERGEWIEICIDDFEKDLRIPVMAVLMNQGGKQ